MDSKQIADRAQFRRCAVAALAGLVRDQREFDSDHCMAIRALDIAAAMMIAEGQAFERYEILALESITANERNRHEQGS